MLLNHIKFLFDWYLHYAFEAQTTYENSHYLMRYVIDELLIIGDYSNAKKYLDKYEHVMLSKRFVEDRNNYIVHSPETDFNRDKVDGIRKRHPKADFYLGNSQYDVLQVVMSDKNNAFATQYLLTSALLQNNLNLFLSLLLDGHCKVNYNNLPRSYQEAVLLYRALSKESRADVENIQIQPYIVRFPDTEDHNILLRLPLSEPHHSFGLSGIYFCF